MKRLFLLSALWLAYSGPVVAADLSTVSPMPAMNEPGGFEARWQAGAAFYLWAAGLNGTVGVGGFPSVDVDASFSDVLNNLDFALMAAGEVRYDRFGVFGDLIYVDLGASGSGPLGLGSASADFQEWIITLMGEYRIIQQGNTSVDLMAGARIWGLGSSIDVTGAGGANFSASGDEWWVDPMIGVKARMQGASPWYLTGWAMIGGFGVSSDIDWDLFGGVGYEVNDYFSMFAGYRGIGVDYQSGGLDFNVVQHGPVVGGVFRF
jgi:hypothetical protein